MPVEFRKIDNLRELRLNPRVASAIALLGISLIAAVAISSSANRSVFVWAANSQIAAGNEIKDSDIKKVRVFLPDNSKLYFSSKANLTGSTLLRTVGAGELIPAAAVSNEKDGKNRKSVPIKVSRNDYPADLARGAVIDIYSLPAKDMNVKSASMLIAHGVVIESIDLRSRDIGGEIGIVIRLSDESIENFLTETINSKLVVVRSAF